MQMIFMEEVNFLGEISNNSITLRTSFIGKELGTNRALLNWFLSQKGKIKGYRNAIYSGLTTLEVAKVLDKYVNTKYCICKDFIIYQLTI